MKFGSHEIRIDSRIVLHDGVPVPLGPRAFDLLLALARQAGRPVHRHELIREVWGDRVVDENNLRVQLNKLRKAVGADTIVHVPGRGYRFTPPLLLQPAGDDPRPGNLPPHAPPLFGRTREYDSAIAAMAQAPLLTLVGPAGIGKTALALALAHGCRDHHADGVWWVELAALTEPELLPTTVAATLGVKLTGRDPLTGLLRKIDGSRSLIVLDNCEHLLDAVTDFVVAVRLHAPAVRLLLTSQRALKVGIETVLPVPPLPWCTNGRTGDAGDAGPGAAGGDDGDSHGGLTVAGAVALLAARASSADPRFVLTAELLPVARRICQRLDGNALAIELAAARVPLLGLPALDAALDDRLRLLKRPAGRETSRHASLRAALDWSHALLPSHEQAVLRRLAVFSGGCSLESAQALAAAPGLDRWAVLDCIGELVDKSLVCTDPRTLQRADETGPRYTMLETVRQFAAEKLAASGELQALRRQHAEHFLALAEALSGGVETRVTNQMPSEADHDNYRAALDWAQQEDIGLGLRMAASLLHFWRARGHHDESMRRCTALMSHPEAERHRRTCVHVLLGLCAVASEREDLSAMKQWAAQALQFEHPERRPRKLALAISWLGIAAMTAGELPEAFAQFSAALPLYEADDDLNGAANVLCHLATTANELGRHDEARALLQQADDRSRRGGLAWVQALVHENLGETEYGVGAFAKAHAHWLEAMRRYRALGHTHRVAHTVHRLSLTHRRLGQHSAALACIQDNVDVCRRHGFLPLLADTMDSLAALAAADGRLATAAQLLAAADRLREEGTPLVRLAAVDRPGTERAIDAALGAADRRAAVAEIEHLDPGTVLDRALIEAQQAPAAKRRAGTSQRRR